LTCSCRKNGYGAEKTVDTHTILINAIQFYVCLQEILCYEKTPAELQLLKKYGVDMWYIIEYKQKYQKVAMHSYTDFLCASFYLSWQYRISMKFDVLFFIPIFNGYCATCISGNAPPSPKSCQ
jgi:hypothetical protein